MRSMSVEERRARVGWRHRLAPEARVDDDVVDVARSVVVLHASDPATVVLSAIARMADPDPSAVERALYEDRSLLRMHGMRRTLFAVARSEIPIVQRSSTDAIAVLERKRLLTMLTDGGICDEPEAWLAEVEARTLAAIDEAGDALATELTKVVPELAIQIPVAQGKRYEGTVGVSSRVLMLLAFEGRLARGRPRGGWTQSQHRWAPLERWLGGPIEDLPSEEAQVALVQRWLGRFGPGTEADLKWWTGWTLGQVRRALASIDVEEVDLDGASGIVLAGDTGPTPAAEPWVALLPSLDPTTMGWQDKSWYLGEHRPQVFDRNGNAGATVWVDGRVAGGWAQRKSGEVVVRLLEDVGEEAARMVEAAAARLEPVLGDVRVTPRFAAPLDRELAR